MLARRLGTVSKRTLSFWRPYIRGPEPKTSATENRVARPQRRRPPSFSLLASGQSPRTENPVPVCPTRSRKLSGYRTFVFPTPPSRVVPPFRARAPCRFRWRYPSCTATTTTINPTTGPAVCYGPFACARASATVSPPNRDTNEDHQPRRFNDVPAQTLFVLGLRCSSFAAPRTAAKVLLFVRLRFSPISPICSYMFLVRRCSWYIRQIRSPRSCVN